MSTKLSAGELRGLRGVPRLLAPRASVDQTLTEIATLLCDVTDADHGVVSVLHVPGTFDALGTHGFTPAQVRDLAAGGNHGGLVHHLLENDEVFRVDDVTAHPVTSGLSWFEPRLGSLVGRGLGTPQTLRGVSVLARQAERGPMTAEAGRLVEAFRPTAEAAIAQALLLHDARQSQRWSEASALFMRDLLTGEVEDPLRRLADTSLSLARAEAIIILLRASATELQVLYAEGPGMEEGVLGARFPLAGSVGEQVMATGEGQTVTSVPDLLTTYPSDPRVADFGPALVLPLRGAERARGVVTLLRRRPAPRFTHLDLRTAQSFADHATVALELSNSRGVQERLDELTVRHEAAKNLHDEVIQRLFATGLSFQQALPEIQGKARERIEAGMASLEETVQEIRSSVLKPPTDPD